MKQLFFVRPIADSLERFRYFFVNSGGQELPVVMVEIDVRPISQTNENRKNIKKRYPHEIVSNCSTTLEQ